MISLKAILIAHDCPTTNVRHLGKLSSWVHVCGLYLTPSEAEPEKVQSFRRALYSRMSRYNRRYAVEHGYSLIDTSGESGHDA
jgi:hypothetical protein